jgi:precorrin-2 C20-methyltransferase / precorrin-3B C17-methyltransferase
VTVPGKLYGVGLGPGDPELVTLKAQRIISSVPVVAYPTARHGRSIARAIAEPYLGHAPQEIAMTFPITVEESDHPGGYEGAIAEHYDRCADEVAAVLESGRDVAALCEGDPFIYGSYIYLHARLAPRFETEVVPGVTSFSAAAALTGRPLVKRDDVLTILPGTLSQDELATRLTTTDGAVVLKLGRRFDDVRAALERAGRGADALYVERVGWPEQRYGVPREIEGAVPYMALVLAPTRSRAPVDPSPTPSAGSLVIVGLGPAGPEWLTPEASATLARADVVVGYETYLARVPVRAGQRRLGSHNRQEIERARSALDLALRGRGRLVGRPRHLRDGRSGARGSRGGRKPVCRHRPEGRTRALRDAGCLVEGRGAPGSRLLRHLALGSAQAVGRDRAADRGRSSR